MIKESGSYHDVPLPSTKTWKPITLHIQQSQSNWLFCNLDTKPIDKYHCLSTLYKISEVKETERKENLPVLTHMYHLSHSQCLSIFPSPGPALWWTDSKLTHCYSPSPLTSWILVLLHSRTIQLDLGNRKNLGITFALNIFRLQQQLSIFGIQLLYSFIKHVSNISLFVFQYWCFYYLHLNM